ncbi:hypothetical protein [Prosthecobacter sp.]|jgi:hypothetical protein|uniref:hypothetical protein n=1 Tax=Prosthecobacter sp. TaxID=1965333 RepID=UPI0037836D15
MSKRRRKRKKTSPKSVKPKRTKEDLLAAAGLTPEEAADLQAWIVEQQRDGSLRQQDPRVWNHALLVFMQQVAAVQVSPQ